MEVDQNNSGGVLLDFCRRDHAIGLGTRADTPEGIRAGMALYLGGNRIREVGPAEDGADALSRSFADGRYCRPRLLWENPAPDSNFAAQTVAADSEGCTFLLTVSRFSTTNAVTGTAVCPLGIPGQAVVVSGSGISSRSILAEAGSVVFGDGYAADTKDNSRAIPVRVYGM